MTCGRIEGQYWLFHLAKRTWKEDSMHYKTPCAWKVPKMAPDLLGTSSQILITLPVIHVISQSQNTLALIILNHEMFNLDNA